MSYYPAHPVVNGKKQCIRCDVVKSVDEFPKNSSTKSGVRPDCKVCNRLKNKEYYQRNKEAIGAKAKAFNKTDHRRAYARKYQAQRARRLRDQEAGRPRPLYCEICNGYQRRICFDHDHHSGAFRGWICDRCNRVLGLCGDDPRLFWALAVYVRERGNGKEKRKNASSNEGISTR